MDRVPTFGCDFSFFATVLFALLLIEAVGLDGRVFRSDFANKMLVAFAAILVLITDSLFQRVLKQRSKDGA